MTKDQKIAQVLRRKYALEQALEFIHIISPTSESLEKLIGAATIIEDWIWKDIPK